MKKYGLLFSFFLLLVTGCGIAFGQETVTISTYYPSPMGIFTSIRVENGNNLIEINNDGGNPNIELRRIHANGGNPYIDFTNDTASNFDFRIILQSDDQLWLQGGTVTTAFDNGTPGILRTGQLWVCQNY